MRLAVLKADSTVNQALLLGAFIPSIAGTASALNIHASGREVTQ
jgi:hypothetical protein